MTLNPMKLIGWAFDEAALILRIKDKKAQRGALALLIAVCVLIVPAGMWGWWQWQNYKFHQLHPNAPMTMNALMPAKPEAK